MPDPNLTLAAIQSHTAALESAANRHGLNAARCKVWSGAIVAGILLFASGKAQMGALPWAAGVVVLLALTDAGQVALARIFTDAYNRFMAKVPLNGGNAMKAEEWLVLPEPTLRWRQAGQVLGALGSFSVWPFYGALLALVVAFHVQTSTSESGSARLLPSSAVKQGSVKSSVPMNVLSAPTPRPPQPANGTSPFANAPSKPAGTFAQPRPTPPIPTFVPSKPSPQQPVVRYPVVPPTQPAPSAAVASPGTTPLTPPTVRGPQNGTPPQNAVPPPATNPPTSPVKPGQQ